MLVCLVEEVLAQWSKDIDQHNFVFHHRCAVNTVGWKVKDIAGACDTLRPFDREADPATYYQSYLLMRMSVSRRDQKRGESKPADHHLFAHEHLPLDAARRVFHRDGGPIQMPGFLERLTLSG